jgi:hypothetical protein
VTHRISRLFAKPVPCWQPKNRKAKNSGEQNKDATDFLRKKKKKEKKGRHQTFFLHKRNKNKINKMRLTARLVST